MSNPRTVTLELLRHGPAHNQLLSPLTRYLALCGNHPAVTVTVPFEQNQLLIRLNALRYGDSKETWKLQLQDTAQVMGNVLGEIPGLIAELSEGPGSDQPLTHLRLILSSSELALLPFELASAPSGFPGAGQPLVLQSQAPLCLTREVRRVGAAHYQWPDRPRILFAAASPPGVADVPLEAHLLALRGVIEPWLGEPGERLPRAGESLGPLRRRLAQHLVVLPRASVASLREACAAGGFTHVHLLAHGVPTGGPDDRRYGLALHDERDPGKKDVVDGQRLAQVLRTYRSGGESALAGPAVVTVASCDSGNQGSVAGAGASVAHALHEAGIPLVVASQFPLSFAASVMMVQVLYDGLLWGVDPRVLLSDLRGQLKARLADTHDWASVVAYAALPADFPDQLVAVSYEQSRVCINTAFQYMDRVARGFLKRSQGGGGSVKAADAARRTRALSKVKAAKTRLVRLLADLPPDLPPEKSTLRAAAYGLLGSSAKREAKIRFSYARLAGKGEASARRSSDAALRQARDDYARAFAADPKWCVWTLVQELSVAALVDREAAYGRPSWQDAWTTARVLSEKAVYAADAGRAALAHVDLLELYLLALLPDDYPPAAVAEAKALEYASTVRAKVGDLNNWYAVRSQFQRYVDWFPQYNPGEPFARVARLAEKVLKELPTWRQKFV